MYYKVHKSVGGTLIAVADKELIGKTLKFKETEFTQCLVFFEV